jgi:hypothetical protein
VTIRWASASHPRVARAPPLPMASRQCILSCSTRAAAPPAQAPRLRYPLGTISHAAPWRSPIVPGPTARRALTRECQRVFFCYRGRPSALLDPAAVVADPRRDYNRVCCLPKKNAAWRARPAPPPARRWVLCCTEFAIIISAHMKRLGALAPRCPLVHSVGCGDARNPTTKNVYAGGRPEAAGRAIHGPAITRL